MMTAVVFLGPSLALAEARAALDAHYLPPARQGDVYRALRDLRPSVIGIVDGLFHQTPSVWHKEILFAMAQGVTIFGAASMGALRAAELCAFGMRGVGTIFEAYRDGVYPPYAAPFERDDEVALIHGPPETGFAALSDALVDMRATLAAAAEAGVIDSGLRDALVARAGAIYYQDRSYDALLEGADGLPEAAIARLRAWLPANRVSQKQRDARALLAAIAEFLAVGTPAPPVNFHFENAAPWHRFRELADSEAAALCAEDDLALDELRLAGEGWAAALRQAAIRHAALRHCGQLGIAADDSAARAAALRLRRAQGLTQPADLAAWLPANGLGAESFARLMREDAILAHYEANTPEMARALADHLKASGAFAPLLAQARAKQQRLNGLAAAARPPSALEADAALSWYFGDLLGTPSPAAIRRQAQAAGFDDEQSFLLALWREYLDRQAQAG